MHQWSFPFSKREKAKFSFTLYLKSTTGIPPGKSAARLRLRANGLKHEGFEGPAGQCNCSEEMRFCPQGHSSASQTAGHSRSVQRSQSSVSSASGPLSRTIHGQREEQHAAQPLQRSQSSVTSAPSPSDHTHHSRWQQQQNAVQHPQPSVTSASGPPSNFLHGLRHQQHAVQPLGASWEHPDDHITFACTLTPNGQGGWKDKEVAFELLLQRNTLIGSWHTHGEAVVVNVAAHAPAPNCTKPNTGSQDYSSRRSSVTQPSGWSSYDRGNASHPHPDDASNPFKRQATAPPSRAAADASTPIKLQWRTADAMGRSFSMVEVKVLLTCTRVSPAPPASKPPPSSASLPAAMVPSPTPPPPLMQQEELQVVLLPASSTPHSHPNAHSSTAGQQACTHSQRVAEIHPALAVPAAHGSASSVDAWDAQSLASVSTLGGMEDEDSWGSMHSQRNSTSGTEPPTLIPSPFITQAYTAQPLFSTSPAAPQLQHLHKTCQLHCSSELHPQVPKPQEPEPQPLLPPGLLQLGSDHSSNMAAATCSTHSELLATRAVAPDALLVEGNSSGAPSRSATGLSSSPSCRSMPPLELASSIPSSTLSTASATPRTTATADNHRSGGHSLLQLPTSPSCRSMPPLELASSIPSSTVSTASATPRTTATAGSKSNSADLSTAPTNAATPSLQQQQQQQQQHQPRWGFMSTLELRIREAAAAILSHASQAHPQEQLPPLQQQVDKEDEQPLQQQYSLQPNQDLPQHVDREIEGQQLAQQQHLLRLQQQLEEGQAEDHWQQAQRQQQQQGQQQQANEEVQAVAGMMLLPALGLEGREDDSAGSASVDLALPIWPSPAAQAGSSSSSSSSIPPAHCTSDINDVGPAQALHVAALTSSSEHKARSSVVDVKGEIGGRAELSSGNESEVGSFECVAGSSSSRKNTKRLSAEEAAGPLLLESPRGVGVRLMGSLDGRQSFSSRNTNRLFAEEAVISSAREDAGNEEHGGGSVESVGALEFDQAEQKLVGTLDSGEQEAQGTFDKDKDASSEPRGVPIEVAGDGEMARKASSDLRSLPDQGVISRGGEIFTAGRVKDGKGAAAGGEGGWRGSARTCFTQHDSPNAVVPHMLSGRDGSTRGRMDAVVGASERMESQFGGQEVAERERQPKQQEQQHVSSRSVVQRLAGSLRQAASECTRHEFHTDKALGQGSQAPLLLRMGVRGIAASLATVDTLAHAVRHTL